MKQCWIKYTQKSKNPPVSKYWENDKENNYLLLVQEEVKNKVRNVATKLGIINTEEDDYLE
jgi:hypothetical protein